MDFSQPSLVKAHGTLKTLQWTERDLTLPHSYACTLETDSYLLTDFSDPKDWVLTWPLSDITEALSLSVKLYGIESVCFSEWLRLYKLASQLGSDFWGFAPSWMEKNREESTLVLETDWPESLVTYLDSKSQYWRSAVLAAKMPAFLSYIAGYAKSAPSVQNFRQFIETVRDFSDVLPSVYEEESHIVLTERKTTIHIKADALIKELAIILAPVRLFTSDNFESGIFNCSFTTDDLKSFKECTKKLEEALPLVDELYKLINHPY